MPSSPESSSSGIEVEILHFIENMTPEGKAGLEAYLATAKSGSSSEWSAVAYSQPLDYDYLMRMYRWEPNVPVAIHEVQRLADKWRLSHYEAVVRIAKILWPKTLTNKEMQVIVADELRSSFGFFARALEQYEPLEN